MSLLSVSSRLEYCEPVVLLWIDTTCTNVTAIRHTSCRTLRVECHCSPIFQHRHYSVVLLAQKLTHLCFHLLPTSVSDIIRCFDNNIKIDIVLEVSILFQYTRGTMRYVLSCWIEQQRLCVQSHFGFNLYNLCDT